MKWSIALLIMLVAPSSSCKSHFTPRSAGAARQDGQRAREAQRNPSERRRTSIRCAMQPGNVQKCQVGNFVLAIDGDPESGLLVVADQIGRVLLFDSRDMTTKAVYHIFSPGMAAKIRIAPGGKTICILNKKGRLYVVNAITGETVTLDLITDVDFVNDRSIAIAKDRDIYLISGDRFKNETKIHHCARKIREIAVLRSSKGLALIYSTEDYQIFEYNTAQGSDRMITPRKFWRHGGWVSLVSSKFDSRIGFTHESAWDPFVCKLNDSVGCENMGRYGVAPRVGLGPSAIAIGSGTCVDIILSSAKSRLCFRDDSVGRPVFISGSLLALDLEKSFVLIRLRRRRTP